jgi:hypothetical protein
MKSEIVFEWCKRFKEGCMSKSQMKTKLITFFDIKGIVHFEYIPRGQTVNQAYCVGVLKGYLKLCIELCPNDWILHHDNAPAHKALSVSFWPKTNGLLK